MTELTDKVVDKITDEMIAAEHKHTNWPSNRFKGLSIISEELGEAHQAALKHVDEDGSIEEFKKELRQTAATCIRMLKSLEEPSYCNNYSK